MPLDCSRDGRGDLGDDVRHLLHRADDLFERLARLVHQAAALVHLGHAVLDQRLDLLGGGRRAAREVAHFGGHHGEAAALLTGARGFHRGVERQQVGLEGDLVDDADDVGDLLAGRR